MRGFGVVYYSTVGVLIAWIAIAACTRIVERPVPVTPPPCLMTLAPTPPEGEEDEAWESYRVRLESWAAHVERACGAHLLPEARVPDDEPAWRSEVPR